MRAKLGKRIDRKERVKASPVRFPDEGPCGIAEAYGELSRAAFAVWIRLAVAERVELRGRSALSNLLGYSRRQGDQVLRELELKGFIAFVPHGPWRRTVIMILRKPLLERGHNFVRFAATLFLPGSESVTYFIETRVQKPRKSIRRGPRSAH